MFGIKRLTRSSIVTALNHTSNKTQVYREIPLSNHFSPQITSNRFLDIYNIGSKEAIAKTRARLADEMTRGYFADISELNRHGGKIAPASKILIPADVAVKFPSLEACFTDRRVVNLPMDITANENVAGAENPTVPPKLSLVCLMFRENSQAMVESWSLPFLDAFRTSEDIRLYEVSFIDKWLLCISPIRNLLLRFMKKSKDDGTSGGLKRQIVYSFGDHFYFRKQLRILNLLTSYIFILDKFGKVRWQGFGVATPEELASLLACTKLLLEED